jgi:hypothetical protein
VQIETTRPNISNNLQELCASDRVGDDAAAATPFSCTMWMPICFHFIALPEVVNVATAVGPTMGREPFAAATGMVDWGLASWLATSGSAEVSMVPLELHDECR